MTEAARLLRYARRRAGLTQRALAARAGVPQPYVARVESSRTDPSVGSLARLLRACGTTLEALPGTAAAAPPAAPAPGGRPGRTAVAALRALHDDGLRYVVVGDVAARLHGAAVRAGRPAVCPHPEDAERCAAYPVDVVARPPGTTGYADLAAGAQRFDAGGCPVAVAALDDLVRIARAGGADPGGLLALRDALTAAS